MPKHYTVHWVPPESWREVPLTTLICLPITIMAFILLALLGLGIIH